MKQRFVLLAFAFCSLLNASVAQQPDQWQEYFQTLLDDDDDLQTSMDEVYDLLSDLAATPRNINTASREDLEELPFLTPWQVESICEYIYKYGGMLTIDELAMIESLDSTRRGLLRCFFYAAPVAKGDRKPSLAEIFSRSRHELTLTAKVPFYKRHGDTDGYLGFPYRHSVRYTFNSMNLVKAGLTGAQDSGEPFFAGRNPLGYDHYSFYIQLMRLGRLKSLVVGRYKAKAGMGLVLNTDFAFGKQAALAALSRNQTTIRPSSSRSSANYLQGAAATVELAKGLDLTAIASWRRIDATLTKDQTAIQTILKTGYHRTESEMQRKNNAAMTALGAHLTFRRGGFNVGITGLFTATSKPLQPNTGQLYRKHYPSGSRFWNASIDYSYRNHWLAVSGETATGSCRALATINTATARLSQKLSLTAVQRFYSYRYYSLLAQAPAVKDIRIGAEIAIEKGVSELEGIEQLAISGTNLILMELPYAPYADWMGEEVYNLSCTYDLMPIIAHLNRYTEWYSKSDIEKVLSLDAVFQFNAEAFEHFDSRRFVSKLIKSGIPYCLGTDTHDLSDRKPNFDSITKKEKPGSGLVDKSDRIMDKYALKKEPLF